MRALVAALISAAVLSTTAFAQDTRQSVLEKQRADKAAQLEPYRPKKLEKLVIAAEEGKLRRMVSPYNGFFADYGWTYKPVGSGIGFSGGFRHDLFNRLARIHLEAGASFRNYQMFRADFSLPRLVNGRLELGVEATHRRHPQEDYYGFGLDTIEDDRVSYLYKGTEYQGRAIVRPRPWLSLGSRVGHLSTTVGSGTDKRFPSIEEKFVDASAPGLSVQPDYLFGDGFAEIDFRDEPGNARSGGHYVVSLRRFSDRSFDSYSFTSVDMLFQHFVPIFDKKRVFAFQTGIIANSASDGNEVPFFMRPTVGGSRTLRSVSDYRFRDNNALWMNAEYRWEAFGLLDMALFTDWGKVTAEASDLDLSDLKHAYGIGFRFNTAQAVLLRIDIATGAGEGMRYFVKFSKAF